MKCPTWRRSSLGATFANRVDCDLRVSGANIPGLGFARPCLATGAPPTPLSLPPRSASVQRRCDSRTRVDERLRPERSVGRRTGVDNAPEPRQNAEVRLVLEVRGWTVTVGNPANEPQAWRQQP